MLDPVEEAKAVEYRRMMTARSGWEFLQRFAAFRSNPAALKQLYADWAPWIDPVREWDPPNEGLDDAHGLQIP